ncbi:MAG: hypothetical protein ACXIVE_15620 [Salinarimonas sp.]
MSASPNRQTPTAPRTAGRVVAAVEAALCGFGAARARPALHLATMILLAGMIGACARTGDLGRPAPSIWNDTIFPFAGKIAAESRGEPVSWFMLTDDERELRDRAWRFLMPAHERAFFQRQVAELSRTRILPRMILRHDRDAYLRPLYWNGGQSPAPLFRRIAEDAHADAALIVPFVALAREVIENDSLRLQVMLNARDLEPYRAEAAAARIAENRCLIAWVRAEADKRTNDYRHALEQLAIEALQREAIDAERAVIALEETLGLFEYTGIAPLEEGRCEADSDGAPLPGRSAPSIVKR